MTFSDFLSRFRQWRRREDLVAPDSFSAAFSESQLLLERDLVLKGRLILKEIEHLNTREKDIQKDREALMDRLKSLSEETQVSEELLSGEKVSFDLSQGKRWQSFWKDAQSFLSKGKQALMIPQIPQKRKAAQKVESFPVLAMKKDVSKKALKQLYDVRHLEQESDELLHYL